MQHLEIIQSLQSLAPAIQQAGEEALQHMYGCENWRQQLFKENRIQQKQPFVQSLIRTLPRECGNFVLVEDLFPLHRVVYRSTCGLYEVSFRRKRSIGSFAKSKQTAAQADAAVQLPLFDTTHLSTSKEVTRIAIIWDLPPLDPEGNLVGSTQCVIRIAERGATLDEQKWATKGIRLNMKPVEMIPTSINFDPEEWIPEVGNDAFFESQRG